MAWFVDLGGEWVEHDALKDAIDAAKNELEEYRDMCDPEWPMEAESVAVYEAPSGAEYPSEDGRQLVSVKEVVTPLSELNSHDADMMREQGYDHVTDYVLVYADGALC